ncbi:MAG: hypothetical protein HYR60_25960, partial [Acidobacteria bacterium]|nr:hypothetical protein [Acidobacteriota bacterium]
VAAVTHAILDPHTLEDTLRRLQAELAKRLNLDILLQQQIPDAAQVDAWLKKKLSHFLDKAIQSGTELDEARKTIHFLLGKRQVFYEKARKALTQKYEAAFAATYQKTVTGTALVDAEFDFAADAAGAGRLLAACLRGDFNRVFTESNAAVRLNQATLSHQIARTSHVELHLPRFARAVDHLNDALAKVSAVEDGGRLLVYDLTATDTVSERNRRNSRLAVAAHLPARKGTGVRVHSTDSISYSYAFRQAVRNMRSSHLRSQVKPYLETYFGAQFTGQASISAWIADLDKQIDRIEFNGTENFGNTLLSLELSLPAEVAAGWLQAPEDKKSPRYMDMSRRIQAKLKQLIPFYYFDDAAKYRDLGAAAPLLVYSSIPPSTDIKLLGDTLTLNPENPDGPYWDFEDRAVRKAMVFNSRTSDALSRALQRAHDALLDAGFSSDAVFFASGELDDFRKTATSGDGDRKLTSLLFVEAEIIDQAHRAGRALAKFRQQAEAGPEDAVQALAAFGAAVTEAFNKNVTGIYGGGSLRPLGTMLFLEAALAFLPGPAAFRPSAIFELTVVKQNAPFALPGFVDVNEPARPEKPDIVIQERLVALA